MNLPADLHHSSCIGCDNNVLLLAYFYSGLVEKVRVDLIAEFAGKTKKRRDRVELGTGRNIRMGGA